MDNMLFKEIIILIVNLDVRIFYWIENHVAICHDINIKNKFKREKIYYFPKVPIISPSINKRPFSSVVSEIYKIKRLKHSR